MSIPQRTVQLSSRMHSLRPVQVHGTRAHMFLQSLRCPRLRSAVSRRTRLHAHASAVRTSEPHLQLATAKIPSDVDAGRFAESMYQWAATLTQSGKNFPFALALQADKLPTGFQISFLKRGQSGNFGSAGDLVGTVEEEPGVGNVLFVRFYEGPIAQDARNSPPPSDPTERLEVLLASLVDVDTIMSTMPNAIRNAVVFSR